MKKHSRPWLNRRNCCLDCRWCVYEPEGGKKHAFYCALKQTTLPARRVWGPPCGDFKLG